tara:strand:+ start:34 stop:342 length:309 start_codon:yes stop_codon:yes gene_type:complete
LSEKHFDGVQKNNLFLKKTLDICCQNAYIIDMNTAKKDSKMFTYNQFAAQVAATLKGNEDRYDQIAAIKKVINESGYSLFATDRETIDSILDILYYEMGYKA